MPDKKLVIISGYFSPLHCGHLDYIEASAATGDKLAVIVNNNAQQIIKKKKIIADENDRLRLVLALRQVDQAMVAIEKINSVSESIEYLASLHAGWRIVFGNGGDRGNPELVPETEVEICQKLGIEMKFNLGGNLKRDSSTRINKILGIE